MRNGIPNKKERRQMQLDAHYKALEAIRDAIFDARYPAITRKQSAARVRDGEAIGLAKDRKIITTPGKRLSTRLLAIERDANRYWTWVCNGTTAHDGERRYLADGTCTNAFEPSDEEQDAYAAEIEAAVAKVLGGLPAGFLVNRDPRGYCLKIENPEKHYPGISIHRDMGGNGILAPEITGE